VPSAAALPPSPTAPASAAAPAVSSAPTPAPARADATAAHSEGAAVVRAACSVDSPHTPVASSARCASPCVGDSAVGAAALRVEASSAAPGGRFRLKRPREEDSGEAATL
jgi:hypothetical protein